MDLGIVSNVRLFSWAWWLEMTQVTNDRSLATGGVVLGKAEPPQLSYLLKTGLTWAEKILSLPSS